VEVQQALHQEEAAREAGDEELPERGSPVEVQQALHQEEAAREAGDEELPERGSPVEVQQTLHQEETGRETGTENLPERRTLWSLKIGAGREMRRPIIVVAVEEACGRRGGNGKKAQESCGNGDKRPAGIAAPREEWENFVGAVEDKGKEDDPHHATRNQAGYPVPGHQRWEPGKWHLELGEDKGLRPGRNSPSFDAATGRRTNRGSVPPAYGDFSLALVMHSNEGGPGPRHNMKEDPGSSTLIMKREHGQEVPCNPGQVIRILRCTSPPLPLPPIRATRTEPPPTPFRYILLPLPKCQLRPASEENTLQPLARGRRPWIGQEEDVEAILSFSALL
jgi:hypothetical protein